MRASKHLTWKYQRRSDDVKSVQDFIGHIAATSNMSGKPYLMKMPDGKAYPMKELLGNELRVLEEHLQNQSSAQLAVASSATPTPKAA